jgi:acetoin utilization deacetylase AcuC-like enzyme
MKIFYSDHINVPLPDDHRFPIEKYALLRKRVMASALFPSSDIRIPPQATNTEILRVHDPDYIHKLLNGQLTKKEIRRIGFPWSSALVARARHSVGGTVQACRSALAEGIGVNLAGGTHHAFKERGEGYCLLNDSAIAIRALQAEALIQRAVVIDCDVHQGNGTAAIFSKDSSVFTFSIHGKNNFPFHKEKSDLDMALEDGTSDAGYLKVLEQGLRRCMSFPDANLVIYLAGADPFREDRYGRLCLSESGLLERDRLVFDYCRRFGVPVAVTMAGGYSRRVSDTVEIHLQTVAAAIEAAPTIRSGDNIDAVLVNPDLF